MPCTSDFFPAAFGDGTTNKVPTIKLQQAGNETITLLLKDTNNNIIDLEACGVDPDDLNPTPVADTPDSCPGNTTCWFYLREAFNCSSTISVQGEFVLNADTDNIEVTFNLTGSDLYLAPGIYLGSVEILTYNATLEDCDVCQSVHYYVEVKQSFSVNFETVGPPTISEIRLMLRDTDPSLNTLLDELEFSDEEIMFCIMQPVDEWNESLPPVAPFGYQNFPYRYNWKKATIAQLLRIAAHFYRRNQLPYSAGGVSVDEYQKHVAYDQMANQLYGEWRQWVKQKKVSINVGRGFGTLGSDYGTSY